MQNKPAANTTSTNSMSKEAPAAKKAPSNKPSKDAPLKNSEIREMLARQNKAIKHIKEALEQIREARANSLEERMRKMEDGQAHLLAVQEETQEMQRQILRELESVRQVSSSKQETGELKSELLGRFQVR